MAWIFIADIVTNSHWALFIRFYIKKLLSKFFVSEILNQWRHIVNIISITTFCIMTLSRAWIQHSAYKTLSIKALHMAQHKWRSLCWISLYLVSLFWMSLGCVSSCWVPRRLFLEFTLGRCFFAAKFLKNFLKCMNALETLHFLCYFQMGLIS